MHAGFPNNLKSNPNSAGRLQSAMTTRAEPETEAAKGIEITKQMQMYPFPPSVEVNSCLKNSHTSKLILPSRRHSKPHVPTKPHFVCVCVVLTVSHEWKCNLALKRQSALKLGLSRREVSVTVSGLVVAGRFCRETLFVVSDWVTSCYNGRLLKATVKPWV